MAKMICGKTAHTHDSTCRNENDWCNREEHTHTDACTIGD